MKSILQTTNYKLQTRKGFTLVELLVVIGIIAILFAVVLVAINPAKRFAEANNARRTTDTNSILNAVTTYTVDKKGVLPSGLSFGSGSSINLLAIQPRFIGNGSTAVADATGFTAKQCYGPSTCAITGFLCTTNADCPLVAPISTTNICNTTLSRCVLSGRNCTANSECATTDSTPTYNNVCVSSARLTVSGATTGTCLLSNNPCTGTTTAADCPVLSATNNTCTSNSVSIKRTYDLGNSSEGIVPDYVGSMPKDPSGAGYMGTSPVLNDADTGYAIFNIPSILTTSVVSGVTMNAVAANATGFVTSADTTIALGSIVASSLDSNTQYRMVIAKPSSANFTVDSAYASAFAAGGTITIYPPSSLATATNRIKVIACNPNDADGDGSFVNNKIEVLR